MATPSRFFDPFFQVPAPTAAPSLESRVVTLSSLKTESGDSVEPLVQKNTNKLPIKGQGTIAVRSSTAHWLSFKVKTTVDTDPILYLDIGPGEVNLTYQGTTTQRIPIPYVANKPVASGFLNPDVETTYWLSVDLFNGLIRYGKYYYNKSMVIIEAQLKYENTKGRMVWKTPSEFSWLERLASVEVTEGKTLDKIPKERMVIHPMPVVTDLSPFVLASDKISLLQLERGDYAVPASLPEACQTLYGSVAGAGMTLDDDEFPFEQTIEESCNTPGRWAYEKLKEKAGEFGDISTTYLRITLGYNLGDSPGIPYVLEIWPKGHGSPIHDHGDACAVIKVLTGKIACTWYNNLYTQPCKINTGLLEKGAVTWLGRQQYQIHRLHNDFDRICCTIQSYRYDDQDDVHFDGFRWVKEDGTVGTFEPNSDASLTAFRTAMFEEWKANHAKK